jgi:hypothetical protein
MDQEHRYRYAAEDQPWNDADAKDAWRWVPRGLVIAGIGLGALAWWLGDANAQQLCGNRSEIIQSLTEHFKEQRRATGRAEGNTILELFVSERGTWTILETSPDGRTCLVSSGEKWSDAGREV